MPEVHFNALNYFTIMFIRIFTVVSNSLSNFTCHLPTVYFYSACCAVKLAWSCYIIAKTTFLISLAQLWKIQVHQLFDIEVLHLVFHVIRFFISIKYLSNSLAASSAEAHGAVFSLLL